MPQKTDNKSVNFVRTEAAPLLPPPASEAGITGWLYQNIFNSMSDFSSPVATIKSVLMGLLTIFLLYVGLGQFWALLDFSLFSAVWSAPEGVKREACLTVDQGGELPSGWHGACWPFVAPK